MIMKTVITTTLVLGAFLALGLQAAEAKRHNRVYVEPAPVVIYPGDAGYYYTYPYAPGYYYPDGVLSRTLRALF